MLSNVVYKDLTKIIVSFMSAQDHMNAKMMSDLKERLLMDAHTVKALDENNEAIISAMKVAFWLGQKELPKDTFISTLEFLDSLGLNLSSKLYTGVSVNYTSHQSVTEFQSAISNTMLTPETGEKIKFDSVGETFSEPKPIPEYPAHKTFKILKNIDLYARKYGN